MARYDQQKYDIFEKLIEKQLYFFWRPEEVDVSRDRIDYQALPEHEKHIFISNLKYQTLLESIQGRSPNVALRPEEVDVSRDRIDYQALPEHEKHIFISNLKYQTLLESIQGRSPNVALLPLISIPELETWVETWALSETILSRCYTHIIRHIVNDPSVPRPYRLPGTA